MSKTSANGAVKAASLALRTGGSSEKEPPLRPPFEVPPLPSAPSISSIPNSPATQNNAPIATAVHALEASISSLTALDSLPTLAGRGTSTFLANDSIQSFLVEDLNLSRLNRIHGHLWMAGRPMRARPLHRYRMMGYTIVPTQQMDLHLLRFSGKLLVKPLPEYLLDTSFWNDHLCDSSDLYASAAGFLLSYAWLLTSPLDLKVAHEHALLPSAITWPWWKSLVRSFCVAVDINSLHQVNPRYQFGDLRLGRINSIYRTRFLTTHFVRGYLYGYNRYLPFFERNFSWLLVVAVFFSLVLSAMQVGTTLVELSDNRVFLKGCYGFVVFSMVSVAAMLGVLGAVWGAVFLFNMVDAIGHARREERARMKLARKSGAKEV